MTRGILSSLGALIMLAGPACPRPVLGAHCARHARRKDRHVLKSGVGAPPSCGPCKMLYSRFVRWAAKGIWADIFLLWASAGGAPAQVLIDSSVVKAHRCASGGKRGDKIRRSVDPAAGEPRRPTP
jgi:hypothetical protein